MRDDAHVRSMVFVLVVCALWMGGCGERQQAAPVPKYTVHVGNWVGHQTYQCERYERDGLTWKLYDDKDALVGEFQIPSQGYHVLITANRKIQYWRFGDK